MSGSVVLVAAVLCGAFVFLVALPIAVSSPYPTPPRQNWAVPQSRVVRAAASGFQLASASAETVAIESLSKPKESLAPFRRVASLIVYRRDDGAPSQGAARTQPDDLLPADQVKADPAVEEATPTHAKRDPANLADVDAYLWQVYQRIDVRKDRSGDFTWKDPAAAKHVGKTLEAYAILGMDPDFREQLYHAGKAMDADGIHWSILSAFRGDYRQKLASGLKARVGWSRHGGSKRVGGYGHGQAVDVTSADGDVSAVLKWIDKHGAKYGIHRPYGFDPAHVEPIRGDWRKIARALRKGRTGIDIALADAREPVRPPKPAARTTHRKVHVAHHYRRRVRYRRRHR